MVLNHGFFLAMVEDHFMEMWSLVEFATKGGKTSGISHVEISLARVIQMYEVNEQKDSFQVGDNLGITPIADEVGGNLKFVIRLQRLPTECLAGEMN